MRVVDHGSYPGFYDLQCSLSGLRRTTGERGGHRGLGRAGLQAIAPETLIALLISLFRLYEFAVRQIEFPVSGEQGNCS